MIRYPDVTIIIPVGGARGGRTLPDLRRALASIGDDPAAEVLVLDDRTDTLTTLWLVAQAAADRRLRVLRGAPEGGAVRARNIGIDVARAPLVAFLDPADIWRPGKLGLQRALHAGHPDVGFSFTDAVPPGGGASALAGWPRFQARHGARRTAFLLGPDALAQLFAENVVMTSTVVARTDLVRELGGFTAGLAAPEWDFWLRMATRATVACRPDVQAETAARPPATPAAAREIATRHGAAARRRSNAGGIFAARAVDLAAAMLRPLLPPGPARPA